MTWSRAFCKARPLRAVPSTIELSMPGKRAAKLRCPVCQKTVKGIDPEFPFCSTRCRTIDLGKWASGEYVITSPLRDAEEPIREIQPEDPEGDS